MITFSHVWALCDDGEKWFNHQFQKPRSCINGFCAFKKLDLVEGECPNTRGCGFNCLVAENSLCVWSNEKEGLFLRKKWSREGDGLLMITSQIQQSRSSCQ